MDCIRMFMDSQLVTSRKGGVAFLENAFDLLNLFSEATRFSSASVHQISDLSL